jgi:Flp pilus assembly pilin Flp
MMTLARQFWRLWRAEQGANIVEYVAVSGIALLITGLIVAGLTAGRSEIGQAMAAYHAALIASFDAGRVGTANTDAAMYPHVETVEWWHLYHMSQPMLGVPAPLTTQHHQ